MADHGLGPAHLQMRPPVLCVPVSAQPAGLLRARANCFPGDWGARRPEKTAQAPVKAWSQPRGLRGGKEKGIQGRGAGKPRGGPAPESGSLGSGPAARGGLQPRGMGAAGTTCS